ncbi:MAG: hypothetical protein LBQ22_10795 [Bacteroidales bacterium]|jgi:serpin B|nr:hypothetical protein [Bacteroidales bacterium]
MKRLFFLICLAIFTASKPYLNDKNLFQNQDHEDDVVYAITQFAIDILYNSVNQDKNTVISPLLLHNLLATLSNGADYKTLIEMQQLLGCNIYEMNDYYKNNIGHFNTNELSVSNVLWTDSGLTINNSFSEFCKDSTLMKFQMVDFSDKNIKNIINYWIDSCTNHTTRNLINEIKPNDKMIVTSTMYFKSQWLYPFFKENNIVDKFYSGNGNVQNAEYICNINLYQYFENNEVKGIILPYNNFRYSFFILMPNKNLSLDDYLQTLSGIDLIELLNKIKSSYTNVRLYLPKFEFGYKTKIGELLKGKQFDSKKLNFSKILSDNSDFFLLDKSYQTTFFSIDEIGTEASSVIVSYIDGSRKKETKPIELKLNRPFVFGIIDNQTSIPIFIGSINKL